MPRLLACSSTCACLALVALATAAETAAPTYRYPDQPGGEVLRKADPGCAILCDGSDDTAVWGQWDVKPFVVEWAFAAPTRIRSLRVAIQHPVNPEVPDTHPRELAISVADAGGAFADEPDLILPIPFQRGGRQVVTLTLPGDGIVAQRLRSDFEGNNRQVVIGEVAFAGEAVDAAQFAADLAARAARRPVALKPIEARPAGRIPGLPPPPAGSIFGVAGHMLHSDHFYPGHFSPYWRLEYTLPFVQRLGIGTVREPIYQAYFGEGAGANRALVEQYISDYEKAGVRVLICAIFANSGEAGTPGGKDLAAFCAWIAGLAQRHPNISAVELGNEPNLPPFWNHGFQDYVATARTVAGLLRQAKPDLPIVVGSFSGMGGVWMRPDLLAEAGKSEAEQSIHWARKCFEAGLLDFADGVSTHPYSESNTQPEGGVFLRPRNATDGYEREIGDFWKLVQEHNRQKRPLKLYITEIGYELTSAHDQEWQADYLSRMMLILFSMRVRAAAPIETVCWYDLKVDDDIVGASGWGLVDRTATGVRPAFTVYRRIAHAFGDTSAFRPAELKPVFANWPDAVKHFAWRRSDGALILAFWRMDQTQQRDVDFASGLELTLPEGFTPGAVEAADLHTDQQIPLGFTVEAGRLRTAVEVTRRAGWLVIHP